MREVKFRAPNFRAKVVDKSKENASSTFRLLYAEDVDAARKYLESIGFDVLDVKTYDFQAWLDKAATARDDALTEYPKARAAGKTYSFDSSIWGELKDHLQDLFQGRCGYCEAQFQAVSFGDVEHYRPKAAVTDDPKHPGYYWLAYDPENYLPACSQCNAGRKRNLFPVKGSRAMHPKADLTQEDPLLLNPYRQKHCDHIAYISTLYPSHPQPVHGRAIPKTEYGRASIASYGLDRDPLVRRRLIAQNSALLKIKAAMYTADPVKLTNLVQDCVDGREEFCTAAATEIDAYFRLLGFPSPFSPFLPDTKLGT
jgi:hypothetical protein